MDACMCWRITPKHAPSEVESLRTRNASETRFHGLIEIFAEPRTEFCPRAKKYTLYRWHREIENLGDLFVAKLLIPAQHERHPLGFREPLNRFLDSLLQFQLSKRCVGREVRLILQGCILCAWLRLQWNMRATLGAAHLVKHQVARNFQQPGRKLGARNISARAFPNPDKDLLRDVFHVRTAAKHARDCACHERLMLLDELFKCPSIAPADQLYQPHVIGVFFRSALISSIVLRHRELDVGTWQNLPEKSALHHPRRHRFCCKPAATCASLTEA